MIELSDWWQVARGKGAAMRCGSGQGEPSPLPAHVGLWLDRMLAEPYSKERSEWTGRLELYRIAVKALAPGATHSEDPPALEGYRPRFEAWQQALERKEPKIERRFLTFEAKSRILLHSASSSTVTDGSILLHHTYGVPFLPGSALKGALRSRLDHFAKGEGEEARRLRELTGEMLGCLRREGAQAPSSPGNDETSDESEGLGLASLIDFHDALWIPVMPDNAPADWSPLALDIVNPHHATFYTAGEGGRRPPRDTDEPIPVHRLSLAPGTRFLVVAEAPDTPELVPWLDWLLHEELVAALADDGLGAWTSAGYGRHRHLQPEAQAKPETKTVPTTEWHSCRVIYEAGTGELTGVLPDGRRARATRAQAQLLLDSMPATFRAALKEKRKREAVAEAEVSAEGIGWKIVALRPPESGV